MVEREEGAGDGASLNLVVRERTYAAGRDLDAMRE
jgi:hypothetical protein